MVNHLYTALIALFLMSVDASVPESETLGSVKHKYLNRKVVLIGHVADHLRPYPVLSEWFLAAEVAGHYWAYTEAYLPATYKAQTATVISIHMHGPEEGRRVEPLAKFMNPDRTANPYFDFVVRFDDGRAAMTAAFPSTISLEVELASEQRLIAEAIRAKLAVVVGKYFYACGITRLYQRDATLDDLLGPARICKQVSDFPFLSPLRIAAAKYHELANAVVLTLVRPDATEVLAIANGEQLNRTDRPFLERVSASLLTEIPAKLTTREIVAIRQQKIFRGMSRDALYYSLGFPKSENDWGAGVIRFAYSDSLVVYLNKQYKIVDWELSDQK
jgi:hypothetical protein